MKQVLNAAGVAYVQASELSQRAAQLAASMLALQTNFDEWMDARFLLSTAEKEQLEGMDHTFKATLSEAIANALLAGQIIAFAKEKPAKESYQNKDVLIFGSSQESYSLTSGKSSREEGLQILIRYS